MPKGSPNFLHMDEEGERENRLVTRDGGAPTKAEQRIRQRCREQAVSLAARHLPDGVREMIRIMLTAENARDRIAAFNSLADRGGLPKLQASYSVEETIGTVKTVTHRYFEPPPSFSETPPAEVLEAIRDFEASRKVEAG